MEVGSTHLVLTALGVATLLIQVVIPLVVGFLTKLSTHAKWKVVLLVILTLANQFFTGWVAQAATGGFNFWSYVVNFVIGLAISVAIHYGVYKPTNVTLQVQNMGVKDNPPRAVTSG